MPLALSKLGRVHHHNAACRIAGHEVRVSCKDSGEHVAGRASDIDDSSERAKNPTLRDRRRFGTVKPDIAPTKY